MNINKILARELKYIYLNNVEIGLREHNLSFNDLNKYVRCGRVQPGCKPDKVFKDRFGDVKPPETRRECLCGHSIVEQCYLCPEHSKDVNDIIIVGNQCIETWGFKKATWGKGPKIECDVCGCVVNKPGLARHKKRPKCIKNATKRKDPDIECDSTTCTETTTSSSCC